MDDSGRFCTCAPFLKAAMLSIRTLDCVAFNLDCQIASSLRSEHDEGSLEKLEELEASELDDESRRMLDALVARNSQAFREPRLVELNSVAIAYIDQKAQELVSIKTLGELADWLCDFEIASNRFDRWLHETAINLFGTWGAYFFLHCIDCAIYGSKADNFHYDDTKQLSSWLKVRYKPRVAHIIWYARHVDGKLSHQQVRDRHQDLRGEDLSRDAIVKAIGRIRRGLKQV